MKTELKTPRYWLVERNSKTEILFQEEYPKYPSVHPGCETLEESKMKWKMPDEPCKCCGNPFSTTYCEPIGERLRSKNICFTCDFWEGYVNQKDKPEVVRVKGWHYWVCEESRGNKDFCGFAGRKFAIRWNDGREAIVTNLWSQGEIPAQFLDQLPDNAVFL